MIKFCILLTASIDTNHCVFTERVDAKTREQDYIKALEMWLNKTSFKIIFCENSGYDLKNIIDLAKKYPNRLEIVQFLGNNYPRYLGKGYGELKIIEKAIFESKTIKGSDYIVKVTGRVFIENVNEIIQRLQNKTFVAYTKHRTIDSKNMIRTVIFIFKGGFLNYLKKYENCLNESKFINFEKIFEWAVRDAKNDGHKCIFIKNPEYIGYSGSVNKEYKSLFITRKDIFLHPIRILFPMIKIRINSYFGKIGIFIKKYNSNLYFFLKKYF